MTKISPILQYDFKSIVADASGTNTIGKLIDHSGNNSDAKVKKGCTIVSDPVMGNCMEFEEGKEPYVALPALTKEFSNGLTICTMVKVETLNDACMVELYTGDGDGVTNTGNISLQVGDAPSPYAEISDHSVPSNFIMKESDWYHLAVTINQSGNAQIYVNGDPKQATPVATGINLKELVFSENTLGKGLGGNNVATIGYFNGVMAWFTLYNTNLDQPAVFDDMSQAVASHIKLSPSLQYDFKAIQPPAQGSDGIGTIADLSGNGYDGIVEQGCTLVSDAMMGNCMEFDGQSGYVKLPALPDTGATDLANGLTITSWVNIASFDESYGLLGLGSMKDTAVFLSAVNGGLINYSNYTKGQNVLQSSLITPADAGIEANQWVHYAVTIDGSGNAVLYIDGKQVFKTNEPNAKLLPLASVVTQSNRIGSLKAGGSRLKGKMAWLSVYNSALKWEQVLADKYQATRPPETLNPALQFDFSTIVPSARSTVGKILDASGNGYDGIVQPGCSLVNDPIMGNCLEFEDSGMVSLPILPGSGDTDFSKEFTLTCWVKVHDKPGVNTIFSSAENNDNGFLLGTNPSNGGKINAFYEIFQGNLQRVGPVSLTDSDQWFHLAFSINTSGIGTLYLNGTEIYKNKTANTQLLPPANFVSFNNTIGGISIPPKKAEYFHGKMAWLCLYNKALKKSEINADMIKGESNRKVSFRRSFPIDFKLYSENNYDQVPILFIEQQGEGKDLYLEISNEGLPELNIPVSASGTASNSNYHFQLRFRPGTLSQNFLKSQPSISGWSVAVGTESGTQTEYISLLCTKALNPIKQGTSYTQRIPSVNANPIGGARNTHVEFNYNIGSKLTGTRLQSLGIISHLGQKDIPLHVDVVGAPQVLNDGSTKNNLLFRMENIGSGSLKLTEAQNSGSGNSQKAPSRFELEVLAQPTGEAMEWALVEQDDVSSMVLDWSVVAVTKSCPSPSKSGSDYTFDITLKEPLTMGLSANAQLNITPPTGTTLTFTLSSSGALPSANQITVTRALNHTGSKIHHSKEKQLKQATENDLKANGIPAGSIITLTNYLGTLQRASDLSNSLTLGSVPEMTFTANPQLLVSPAPKIYAKVQAYDAGTNQLTFTERLTLWKGSIVSTLTPVGSAKGANNTMTVDLVHPHSGTVPAGTQLAIVSPSGDKITAEVAKDSHESDHLEVKYPITVEENSSISYSNEVGTVAANTTQSETVKITPYTPSSGVSITPTKGNLLVISSALEAPLQAEYEGISGTTITLKHKLSRTAPAGSIVSLEAAQADWKLVQNNQTPSTITGQVSWTITSETVTEIAGGESLEFLLRDIVTGLPAGTSLVTLRYYNIPGYWDGKLTIPIQKGPVIYDGQKVGIGTNLPVSTLDVDGTVTSTGLTVNGLAYLGHGSSDFPKFQSPSGSLAIGWNHSTHDKTNNNRGEVDLYNTRTIANGDAFRFYQMTSATAANLLMSIAQNGDADIDGKITGTGLTINGPAFFNHNSQDLPTIPSENGGLAIGWNKKSGQGETDLFNVSKSPFGQAFRFYQLTAKKPDNPLTASNKKLTHLMTIYQSGDVDVEGTIASVGLNVKGPTLIGQDNTKTMPDYTGSPGGLAVSWNNSQNSSGEVDLYNTYSSGGDAFHFYQMTAKNAANLLMAITQDGKVGIGSGSPSYPLHVKGKVNYSDQAGEYYGNPGSGPGFPAGSHCGLYVDHSLVGTGFYSTSDERIKENIILSNTENDLKKLLQIEVKDYQFKDKIGQGTRLAKGLIAQDLEKLFPQSVNKHTAILPNIFTTAKRIKRNKKKEELTIHLEKKHKITVGDVLQLISDDNQFHENEVIAVPDAKVLVVKGWKHKTKNLFVYGKKVDDLRAIDYQQVAMLNVSATQQLHKALEATKKENKKLKIECKQLKTQFEEEMGSLRAELEAIKNLIKTQG